MIKRNSQEWKTFIERLEAVKLKSNREVLCFKCWQMLNCKQKVKHLKTMPKHGDFLITSTKYASESQILELARAHNKIHVREDGEEYLVSPYGGTLAETILEHEESEEKNSLKSKIIGKVPQNYLPSAILMEAGQETLGGISQRLSVLESKVDLILSLLKGSACQYQEATARRNSKERFESDDFTKLQSRPAQDQIFSPLTQIPKLDPSSHLPLQQELINGLLQNKPISSSVQGSSASPYLSQLQFMLLQQGALKPNLIKSSIEQPAGARRSEFQNQNLSGFQASYSDRQQFNVLNSWKSNTQSEMTPTFKTQAAFQEDKSAAQLKRKVTQIYPKATPLFRSNTQGSHLSTFPLNHSMADEGDESLRFQNFSPSLAGTPHLSSLPVRLDLRKEVCLQEVEDSQSFISEEEEEQLNADTKLKEFVAKVNAEDKLTVWHKHQQDSKMAVEQQVREFGVSNRNEEAKKGLNATMSSAQVSNSQAPQQFLPEMQRDGMGTAQLEQSIFLMEQLKKEQQ